MTDSRHLKQLSRRERQIMDVIFKLGKGTVSDVMDHLGGKAGNSTVRKQLNILEEKGFLRHEAEKNYNIFYPTIKIDKAGTSQMKHLLDTFFQGSVSRAFVTLLKVSESDLSDEDRKAIMNLIDESKEEGR